MPKVSLQFLIKYWLPPIIWASMIFTFSTMPTHPAGKIIWWDFIIKKAAHLTEYAIFSILIYRALVKSNVKKLKASYLAIFLAFLYGASDEFHQSFTPGRTPRAYDVGFDTIGGILGIYLIWKLLPKAPLRLKKLATDLELH